jgi:hypothetical protein
MKRNEAIKKLMPMVISPFEILKHEYYENGVYLDRAERLLDFIEKDLNMRPSGYCTLMANGKVYNPETDFGRDTIFHAGWEPEDE